MGGYQSGFTDPGSSPNVTPSNIDVRGTTDLMLVIQSVTDQSKNLGAVCAEVSHLKSVVTEESKDLKDVKEKSIRAEIHLNQIDKTLSQLNTQLERGFGDMAKSIEKNTIQQAELLELKLELIKQSVSSVDLKLAPINQFALQTSTEVKEIKTFVEDLKRFRWMLGGVIVILPVALTIITTLVMRTFVK